MQFDLIKEILTGSITGYITNAIAIKMIFREYGVGKLKVGGLIVKTREEFIDNVSSLVERDIINHQTLSDELEKESFRECVKKIVEDFLNIHICKNTSNLYLGELEGFEPTINKTQDYIRDCMNEKFPIVFDSLCKNVQLKNLISEKQVQHISGEVFNNALEVLNNEDFIEKAIEDFYNENKGLSFNEFFGNALMNIISKNFEDNIESFHIDLKANFDSNIDNIFENTIKTLEIHKILNSLEEDFLEKRIIDFIGTEDNGKVSRSLIVKIKEFLVSDEGKELINNFGKEIYNLLKSIDKSVLDLLSDNLKDNIENFLKDKLQYAVKEIILWIEQNKGDIEGLIEKAIDDTVQSIDNEMKKNVINLVKDKFLTDVAKKFDIVLKITEYLNQNADIDSISKDITYEIIKYLNKEKISDVITMLEKNKILTEESFNNFIIHNINNYLDYISEDYFYGLLNKKLKDIFSINLVSVFESHAKEPIISMIKERYIYTENTTQFVKEQIGIGLKRINTSKLGELLTKDDVPKTVDSIKKTMIEGLKNNEDDIKNMLFKELNNSIESINLYNDLKGELRENILDKITSFVLDKTDNLLKDCRGIEVKKVYGKINDIENINDILTDSIISTLKDNLQHVLKGNIKEAVSNNLRNLKDEELQVMVENFMGTEMKPLTIIGAVLGAVVGIGMYFFDKSAAQYNYVTGTIISIIVYGLVGWITNVQALAMLFKPYTEKRVFGIRIPFTPGVIVSRKPKFARSMSNFVAEELLKKRSIEVLFDKNKDYIYKNFRNIVSKDDYKVLGEVSYRYSDSIANKAYEYGRKAIYANKDKISNSLVNEIGSFSPSNMDFSNIQVKAQKEILEKIKGSDVIINNAIDKFLKLETSASEVIPKETKALIKKYLEDKLREEIDNMLVYISKEDKSNYLSKMLSSRYEKLANKPVNQIISEKEILNWNERLNSLISSKIVSEESRGKILNWIEEVISRELNPNRKIEDLFGGFFVKLAKDNFGYIMESVIKSIVKGVTNNQQVIAEVAITTTKESLNFFELMGYNMLGGDEIISSIVDNLINDKFPDFIESKKDELQAVLGNFIGNQICNSTIADLNIKPERSEVVNAISEFINDAEKISLLNNNIIKITDSFFNWMMGADLEEYLSILSINNVEDLIGKFKDEIAFVEKELENNINIKKELLAREYSNLVYDIFEGLILSKKIHTITMGIDGEYARNISKKLIELLYESGSINNNSSDFVKCLINELKGKNINELMDVNEFNNSMVLTIEKVIENKEIDEEMKTIIDNAVKDIAINNLNIIDAAAKAAISDIVLRSIVDSTEQNFSNILNNVDFKGITEKEINNMEPKEIEDLFNSFAKKYFNRLKLYGFGGAIFGIHWIIGVISAVLYAGSAAKEQTKKGD